MIRPAVGVSNPATIRSVVVLPQPDGPSSATSSPDAASSVSSETARTSPKRFVRPRSLISANQQLCTWRFQASVIWSRAPEVLSQT